MSESFREHIFLMDRPPQSSDFNPTGNFWDVPKKILCCGLTFPPLIQLLWQRRKAALGRSTFFLMLVPDSFCLPCTGIYSYGLKSDKLIMDINAISFLGF